MFKLYDKQKFYKEILLVGKVMFDTYSSARLFFHVYIAKEEGEMTMYLMLKRLVISRIPKGLRHEIPFQPHLI